METAHKRPNYILIWVYLAVLTAAELALAFELPISRNLKLVLLLFLAVWKALLVALFFLELTKPRITQLVLLTAAAGFYLGSGAHVDVRLLAHTLLGVALVAAGTNAFNQVLERDVDRRMRRTERRPLPSGRIGARAAALFAGVISLAGVAYLAL